MKKRIIAFICVIVVVVSIICIYLCYTNMEFSHEDVLKRNFIDSIGIPPNAKKMQKIFNRDQNELCTIVGYFINTEHSKINISEASYLKSPNIMSVSNGSEIGNVVIEDEAVLQSVKKIFEEQGYDYIGKNGNTIYFQEWSALRDNSRGIAYSVNKKDEPEIYFLTKLEPLDEEGWYYYEVDYNEWRIQHEKSLK